MEVDVREVTVRVCADGGFSVYTFQCPSCHEAVVRPATRRVVDELVASCVRLVVWRLPDELNEPRPETPMTFNDLVDLQRLLEEKDWIKRLLVREN